MNFHTGSAGQQPDHGTGTRTYGLSKSRIAAFEQCPKRLWLSVHRPSDALTDPATTARFSAGHEVGELACEAYPDGVMVEVIPSMEAALQRTAELIGLQPPRPIFEATFRREGVLVRVDLMIPAGNGAWHVAEVKSSTSAKPYQISDLATQIWVLQGCGVRVASSCIRCIDRDFVYQGDRIYTGLFKDEPADDLIIPLIATRSSIARDAMATLQGQEPARETGDHCLEPFACPYLEYCNQGAMPPEWPISLLPNTGRRLAEKWAETAILELTDLDENALTSELHRRVHRACLTGDCYHDVEGARDAIAGWPAPFAFLDFETIALAVPRWAGIRPYQAVPFQFSVHVEQGNGILLHREFIDLSGGDPRRDCAETLLDALPGNGAIVAYNASFERSRIRELAAEFADLAPRLMPMADRVVDLLPVARAHYYHRDQRGSWSIKSVLPTIAPELGYSGLEVGDGTAAQLAYGEAVDPVTSAGRREQIKIGLRRYCALDTWAMVVLTARLAGLSIPPRPEPCG